MRRLYLADSLPVFLISGLAMASILKALIFDEPSQIGSLGFQMHTLAHTHTNTHTRMLALGA